MLKCRASHASPGKSMRYRVATLIVCLAAMLLWFASTLAGRQAAASPEPQRRATRPARRGPAAPANFDHATRQHGQACDTCHKFPSKKWEAARKKGEAFPDITEYPDHASCLDCHRQQFFARERPQPRICAVCHTGVTPRNTERHPFPTLSERFDASEKGRGAVSDFAVNFPHDRHEGLFSRLQPAHRSAPRFLRASFAKQDDLAKANAACATCHQTFRPQGDSEDEFVTPPPKNLAEGAFWLRKGTFKTTPRDHSTCFTCHSADSGLPPAPSDCAACHKLLPPGSRAQLASAHDDFDPRLAAAMGITDRTTLLKWSRRGAARFRHEWPPHDLACAACHNVALMNTADEATKKVPVMSCGGGGTGCHVEPTGDGVLNLAVARRKADPSFTCTTCHVLNGRRPVPATHEAAVTAAPQK